MVADIAKKLLNGLLLLLAYLKKQLPRRTVEKGVGLEGLQLYQKKFLTQLLSNEFCEVFKNTYFEEHL